MDITIDNLTPFTQFVVVVIVGVVAYRGIKIRVEKDDHTK